MILKMKLLLNCKTRDRLLASLINIKGIKVIAYFAKKYRHRLERLRKSYTRYYIILIF